MSKVLDATCVNNVVTSEGVSVSEVSILSEGVAASTGILILEESKKTYVAKTSPDLKLTIEKIASALTNVASALTTIDAKDAPAATATIALITAAVADLNVYKEALK